ncbi:hypothetical protein GTCCBUS3UF5_30570 [Geobacillus thermoleovorans CCB_US3_UF5]|uniref:Uncharacterized protein n=2 Tax=Geobacillus thermoleovorans group TaxID=1505648 RepID=U2XZC8_GEOKU|nr:hypothetical protein GTCCBUS3UF5_30570 [Geobacillus thermoleovorans CCB_US3_UF5]GAD11974.1 hypothetical protein GBL_0191 [Geobacillus kaustophilus GBlys]GAJ57890.1 hypothetical protein B23_1096 [Geobacillus thermoleovorans B23]
MHKAVLCFNPLIQHALHIVKQRPIHPISRRRLPLQRPKGVSGRGMRVPPFFCV